MDERIRSLSRSDGDPDRRNRELCRIRDPLKDPKPGDIFRVNNKDPNYLWLRKVQIVTVGQVWDHERGKMMEGTYPVIHYIYKQGKDLGWEYAVLPYPISGLAEKHTVYYHAGI